MRRVHLPFEHGQMVEGQRHVELGHRVIQHPIVFVQVPIIVEKHDGVVVLGIHSGENKRKREKRENYALLCFLIDDREGKKTRDELKERGRTDAEQEEQEEEKEEEQEEEATENKARMTKKTKAQQKT